LKQTIDPVYENLLHMGRSFHPRARRKRSFVTLSPLVDVLLLLAFFFVLQSSFVLQPGVYVDLVDGEFTAGVEYGNMVVTVTREKTLLYNDEPTTLPGLADILSGESKAHPGEPLLIQADRDVPHSTIGGICDLAKAAGIREAVIAHSIKRSATSETP